MKLPTQSQVFAIGRHVATAAGVLATVLGAVHLADANALTEGIGKVGDGLAEIAVGLGPIVGLVSAFFAARSASTKAQVAAVKAADPVALTDAVNATDPTVLINAVNTANNGVKVVASGASAQQVNQPLK